MNPLISVIVPIYNRENFLDRCLSSIINQTYKNIEIILIDDGSTDTSLEICKKYAATDERIKVIFQENSGVSKARNHGLEIATGEYVQFVDSDDFIESNMCQTFIDCINNDPTIEYIICGLNYCTGEGSIDYTTILPLPINKMEDFYSNFFLLLNRFFRYPTNKFFKLSIIKQNNIRFLKGIYIAEDAIFNIDYLSKTSNVKVIEDCLYNVVEHNTSRLTTSFNEKEFEAQYIFYNKLISYLKEHNCYYKDNKSTVLEQYIYNYNDAIRKLILSKNNLKTELNKHNKFINPILLSDYKYNKLYTEKFKRCKMFSEKKYFKLIFTTLNKNFDRFYQNFRNKLYIKCFICCILIILLSPYYFFKTIRKYF